MNVHDDTTTSSKIDDEIVRCEFCDKQIDILNQYKSDIETHSMKVICSDCNSTYVLVNDYELSSLSEIDIIEKNVPKGPSNYRSKKAPKKW